MLHVPVVIHVVVETDNLLVFGGFQLKLLEDFLTLLNLFKILSIRYPFFDEADPKLLEPFFHHVECLIVHLAVDGVRIDAHRSVYFGRHSRMVRHSKKVTDASDVELNLDGLVCADWLLRVHVLSFGGVELDIDLRSLFELDCVEVLGVAVQVLPSQLILRIS